MTTPLRPCEHIAASIGLLFLAHAVHDHEGLFSRVISVFGGVGLALTHLWNTRRSRSCTPKPLFLLASIAVGLLALMAIPREEEPQISVPMVDIQVMAPGLAAPDAVELVGIPLETIVKSVDGVEHVYTQAEDDGVMVTARFLVGSDPEDAAIRINEKLQANWDRIPVGIPDPKVTVRGINDVPIVVLTLTPKPGAVGQWSDQALYELAGKLRTEIAKVDNVGLTFITGGRSEGVKIRLTALGITEYYSGVKDKLPAFQSFLGRTGMLSSDVCYMGDDMPDIPVMRRVIVSA